MPTQSDASDNSAKIIGEVIEATTTHFVAQCPRPYLHQPPAFGSFVKIEPGRPRSAASPPAFVDPFAETPADALPTDTPDGTLYALVYTAATGSGDTGRRPAAYGLDEETLREEQPQIFDLLTTEFAALHLGFAQEGRIRSYLPPQPPRLHAFVTECSPAEVCALTDAPDFLRSLRPPPNSADADELIAACLRHAYRCRHADFTFLVRAGKQLANLLRDDPDRLTALLRKIEPPKTN
jgi:hypothetical protein